MKTITRVNLYDVLCYKLYHDIHEDIKANRHTHYWAEGGRGSLKSSTWAVEIVLGIMRDPKANAVALRKVASTLKDSVFEKLEWAIEMLHVSHLWKSKVSPLSLIYIPTGQTILFRGADKPKRIKSMTFKHGYCKYIWYEELDEFGGMDEIRIINQSLMRGGDTFVVLHSYNPPRSVNSWVNAEIKTTRPDRLVHHSTYLDVPREWLGEQFIVEAEYLKQTKLETYEHEYLGKAVGTGGDIFPNVQIRTISDEEIQGFENIKRGIDFGFAADPFTYNVMAYDRKYKRLYIYYEIRKSGLSNHKAHQLMAAENIRNEVVKADSAEPKSIYELNQYGMKVTGAKKGLDSVEYGIKFLQDLDAIVIDDVRCPETAQEFKTYELARDASGNFKDGYPDKNNHHIDAVRYAMEDESWKLWQERKKPKNTKPAVDWPAKKESYLPKKSPGKGFTKW